MKQHTVKTLITHLQALPPNLPVFVSDREGVIGCEHVYKTNIARRVKGEDKLYGGTHIEVCGKQAKRKRLAVVIC